MGAVPKNVRRGVVDTASVRRGVVDTASVRRGGVDTPSVRRGIVSTPSVRCQTHLDTFYGLVDVDYMCHTQG